MNAKLYVDKLLLTNEAEEMLLLALNNKQVQLSYKDKEHSNALQLDLNGLHLDKPLEIASGGTGANSADGALINFGLTVTAAELNKLNGLAVTADKINYLIDVNGNLQDQLNDKLGNSGDQVLNGNLKIFGTSSLENQVDESNVNKLNFSLANSADIDFIKNNEVINGLSFKEDSTSLIKPLELGSGGTGATTAFKACNNLKTLSLDYVLDSDYMISSGDDLNTYLTPGVYRCNSSAISQSLVNGSPYTGSGFRLIVSGNSSTTGIIQIAFYNATSNYVYYRIQSNSGTWSEWANLMKNVLSAREYGSSFPANAVKGQVFFKKL